MIAAQNTAITTDNVKEKIDSLLQNSKKWLRVDKDKTI